VIRFAAVPLALFGLLLIDLGGELAAIFRAGKRRFSSSCLLCEGRRGEK
jgi:hypothetical protein